MRDEALAAASCLSELGVGAASISNPVTQQQTTTPAISTTMAQLDRLRKLFDEQERMFTTVPGLADYITQLGPSRGSTCAIRLCFLRGNHFSTGTVMPPHCQSCSQSCIDTNSCDPRQTNTAVRIWNSSMRSLRTCSTTRGACCWRFRLCNPGAKYAGSQYGSERTSATSRQATCTRFGMSSI